MDDLREVLRDLVVANRILAREGVVDAFASFGGGFCKEEAVFVSAETPGLVMKRVGSSGSSWASTSSQPSKSHSEVASP